MNITSTTENRRAYEFLQREANGTLSRDQVTLLALNDGTTIHPSGKVLGQITKGAATFAANGANTGNPTCSAVTTSAGLKLGVYNLEMFSATKGNLFDPTGIFVGVVTFGSAFAGGGLGFTVTAGGTAAIAGDSFTFTVAAGSGKFVALDPSGKDGREVAAAILGERTDVSGSADVLATVINMDAEVSDVPLLDFGSANGGQVTAAKAQLLALGIKVRAVAN